MKLLIVDDEYHVIKSIKFLLSTFPLHFDQIFSASSVKEAINLIETEQPHIIITDISMDELTGIDLMEYLNHIKYSIKIIVISGYNNFDYIRSTLQNGGVDYLLKPIEPDQLLAALKKAIELYQDEESKKMEFQKNFDIITSMSTICRESLIHRMMSQSDSTQYLAELCHIMPELASCQNCLIGYFCPKELHSSYEGHMQEKLQQISERLNSYLETRSVGLSFFTVSNGGELFIFLYNNCSQNRQLLEKKILEIEEQLSLPLTFGLSTLKTFPTQLTDGYQEAVSAFWTQDIMHEHLPVHIFSPKYQAPQFQPKPELERAVFSALLTGNEMVIDQALSRWTNQLFAFSICPLSYLCDFINYYEQLIQSWKRELLSYYKELNLNAKLDPLTSERLLENNCFQIKALNLQIKKDMLKIYDQLTSHTNNPQSDTIYQIAHYLNLNYNRPFDQSTCAKLFYINKDYMCRKFKTTFQTNMVSYLNTLRIQHAKEFLSNPDIKAKDVAFLVGFNDEKYFFRQFRKFTGYTPNEYRKQQLTIS